MADSAAESSSAKSAASLGKRQHSEYAAPQSSGRTAGVAGRTSGQPFYRGGEGSNSGTAAERHNVNGSDARDSGTGVSDTGAHTRDRGGQGGGGGGGKGHRREEREKHIYGNYDNYYQYRWGPDTDEPRLLIFKSKPEWFKNKRCLDIGCNSGGITTAIASQLEPSHILGVDLDVTLVRKARHNLFRMTHPKSEGDAVRDTEKATDISVGSADADQTGDHKSNSNVVGFPNNCAFRLENYVKDDPFPDAEYDLVLCLSTTKWIHYHGGDEGIVTLFHKVYASLSPGGRFIMEPQDWASYKKKKTLTPEIKATVAGIKLAPELFKEYLLENVGFKTCEEFDAPKAEGLAKGFERALLVFVK